MTLYFSKNGINNSLLPELRKNYPRGLITANRLNIKRANTIDYQVLLRHFECAVAKTKDFYNVAIVLPLELTYKVPSWIVQGYRELWVNPKPEITDINMEGEQVFIVEFHFYIDEKKLHKFPETAETPVEEALLEEFIEIRHALIQGKEEPIDLFRKFYIKDRYITPKSRTGKYLDAILKTDEQE